MWDKICQRVWTQDMTVKGTLPKTGETYEVTRLSAGAIDDVLALQDLVIDALPEEHKPFLLRKTRSFFEKHFKTGGVILGAWVDDTLIAQSIIVHPDKDRPNTGMVDMRPVGAPETLSILQGVAVHPNFRGNGLMETMVDLWLDFAAAEGREHAVAEIDARNHYSWGNFVDRGLNIVGIGIDKTDGTRVYNAHERLENIFKKRMREALELPLDEDEQAAECNRRDLTLQSALFSLGYVGIAHDPDERTMVMMHKKIIKDALSGA